MEPNSLVRVRRQWNSQLVASYRLKDIDGIHWSATSGGVRAPAPGYFLHGYVSCAEAVDGDLDHSCRHGEGPHRIKVCIVKKDNERDVFESLRGVAGPKPEFLSKRKVRALRRASEAALKKAANAG